jgi:hypothetical protein
MNGHKNDITFALYDEQKQELSGNDKQIKN